MREMVIFMPKLSVGGMEFSLINLLNMSDFKKKYQITLYLGYVTDNDLLLRLPSEINVKLLCKRKWDIFGKIVAFLKMCIIYLYLVLFSKKYSLSICYAYQHFILSVLARKASKNNVLFIHSDLKMKYKNNVQKKMNKMKYHKFNKIVCVSNASKNVFLELCPDYDGTIKVIYNYINVEKIITGSKEKISDFPKCVEPIFINVSRHLENTKKISRILYSTKKLNDEGYKFSVILVGDGEDSNEYRKYIENNKLDNIHMVGKKVNPYPYMLKSQCVIQSSLFEGYGVTIDEAKVLNKPIISTAVADAKLLLNGFGITCNNSKDGIYKAMKQYLDNGYMITKEFDCNAFNNNITRELNDLVGDL